MSLPTDGRSVSEWFLTARELFSLQPPNPRHVLGERKGGRVVGWRNTNVHFVH